MLVVDVHFTGTGGLPAATAKRHLQRAVWGTRDASIDESKYGLPKYATENVASAIEASSYGKVSFPESKGRIVRVEVDGHANSVQHSTGPTECPAEEFSSLVLESKLNATVPNWRETYHMVHYVLPNEFRGGSMSKCYWQGQAYIALNVWSYPARSWSRTFQAHGAGLHPTLDTWMNTVVHELGHSIGLQHALSLPDFLEYGDYTCIMGRSATLNFNAAQRLAGSWIGSDQILDWSRPQQKPRCSDSSRVRLRDLNSLKVPQGQVHTVILPRLSTLPLLYKDQGVRGGATPGFTARNGSNGVWVISLRTSEGPDRHLGGSPQCNSTCPYKNDGTCDDGGFGSTFADCDIDTDCNDCTERLGNRVYVHYRPPLSENEHPVSLAPYVLSPISHDSLAPRFVRIRCSQNLDLRCVLAMFIGSQHLWC